MYIHTLYYSMCSSKCAKRPLSAIDVFRLEVGSSEKTLTAESE